MFGRILKKLAKILLWLAGVLLGLVILAWLVLVIFFPDDKIRRMLVEELEDTLKIPVQAGELDLEILSGLSLKDVTLGPPPGFDRPVLKVKRLLVDYTLVDIFRKQFTIRRVVIDRPEIVFEDTPGGNNLQALLSQTAGKKKPAEKPAGESEGGFVLDLEWLEVRDAQLAVKSPAFQAHLLNLGLTAQGKLGGPAGTSIRVRGELTPPEQPNLSLELPQATGLGKLTAAAGFDIEAGLEGAGRVGCKGKLVLERLSYGDGQSQLEILFEGHADLAGGTVVLKTLQILLDGIDILSAKGDVSDLNVNPSIHVTLQHLLLPSKIMAGVLERFAPDVKIDGVVRVEGLSLEGSLQGELPRASARAKLQDVAVMLGADGNRGRLEGLSGDLQLNFVPEKLGGVLVLNSTLGASGCKIPGVQSGRIEMSLRGKLPVILKEQTWQFSSPEIGFKSSLSDLKLGSLKLDQFSVDGGLSGGSDPFIYQQAALQIPELKFNAHADAKGMRLNGQRLRDIGVAAEITASRLVFDDQTDRPIGQVSGILELMTRRFSASGITLSRPRATVSFQGRELSFDRRFGRPLQVKARIKADSIGAPSALMGSVALDLSTRIAGPTPGSLPVAMKLAAGDLQVRAGFGELAVPGPHELGLSGMVDLDARRMELKELSASLAGLARLRAGGEFDWGALSSRLEFGLGPVGIERALALLPESLRLQLPRIAGKLSLEGKFGGPLPRGPLNLDKLPFDASATLHLLGVDLSMTSPPLSLEDLSGRVQVGNNSGEKNIAKATVQVSAAKLEIDPSVRAKGVSLVATTTRDGSDLTLVGHAGFVQLDSAGLLDRPLGNLRIEFDSRLLGRKELRLSKLELSMPSLGLTLDFGGRLMRTPGTWDLTRWRMSSKLTVGLRSSTPVKFPGSIGAVGDASLSLSVESISEGVFSTRGKIAFEGLSLQGQGFALKEMRGTVPVSQLVAIRPVPGLLAGSAGETGENVAAETKSRAYEEALLPMKGSQRSFSIAGARLEDLEFRDITGNLELAEGHLLLGSLRLGFLEGDVIADARVTFAPPGTRRLTMSAEMSGVDLSGLGALAFSGSSDISGNLHLGMDINEKAFSASVNLTRIGRSTLQALLVAMDPQETNPGVMELRGYLSRFQVSPERVSLDIRHGLLGMEVVLKMGLTARAAAKLISGFHGNTFRLKHLPIGGMLSKYLGY